MFYTLYITSGHLRGWPLVHIYIYTQTHTLTHTHTHTRTSYVPAVSRLASYMSYLTKGKFTRWNNTWRILDKYHVSQAQGAIFHPTALKDGV